jgi:hypothetical protein
VNHYQVHGDANDMENLGMEALQGITLSLKISVQKRSG